MVPRRKVLTMSDSRYFEYGKYFLLSRNVVDADFVLYGPDLNKRQRAILRDFDIEYRSVDPAKYEAKMQMLKFEFLQEDGELTFCDFDTFFKKDWGGIFKLPFDIGVTIRQDIIDRKSTFRAYANGGVIFSRNPKIFQDAIKIIKVGADPSLPEYDEIWKTLEEGRRPEKTHYRHEHRWWVDQIFLSALVLRQRKNKAFKKYKARLFQCTEFNYMSGTPDDGKDYYIGHLKGLSGAPSELKG